MQTDNISEVHWPGDLTLAPVEKLTNQNLLNAQLSLNVFNNDFVILSLQSIHFHNQSSGILQHSQNRPTGDSWLNF